MYYLPHIQILTQWISIIVLLLFIVGNLQKDDKISDISAPRKIAFWICSIILYYSVLDDVLLFYNLLLRDNEDYLKKYNDDNFFMILFALNMHWIAGLARTFGLMPFIVYLSDKITDANNKTRKLLFRMLLIVAIMFALVSLAFIFM